jgi:hypothetical protein
MNHDEYIEWTSTLPISTTWAQDSTVLGSLFVWVDINFLLYRVLCSTFCL